METDKEFLKSYPDGLDWNIKIPKRPLYCLFDDSAARFPEQPCIDFLGKVLTYSEVSSLVDRATAGFQKLGVVKGMKVGLLLPNCPQFVISYYAILKAGGTVVNYSPLCSERELLHQVEDSETDIIVTLNFRAIYQKAQTMLTRSRIRVMIVGDMAEFLPTIKKWFFPLVKFRDIERVKDDASHIFFGDLINNEGKYKPVKIDPSCDVAALQYTGGTTGIPKGAILTHFNLYANTLQCGGWFPALKPGSERVLGVLPFFHIFAMTAVLNFSMYLGALLIIHPRFEAESVLRDIDRKSPTLFDGVPTMFAAINAHPNLKDFNLTSIKACISGGAPLPKDVKKRFEDLSGCMLVEGYGLTETSPVATCNPFSSDHKAGSIGLPLPGTIIKIFDCDDPNKTLGKGEIGEIYVSGPQVMTGYWRDKLATREVIFDGRLRTGDLGYIDEDGFIFIIDRIKDLILVSGFNVYPRNVEEAIYQHPAVHEVTVVGISDEFQGQSVKAFIKTKEDQSLNKASLLAFLENKLGKHEMPRYIEFRDDLPKTMIGKLSKKELIAEEELKLG